MSFVWMILTVNSSSFRKMGFAKASFVIISSTIMQQFTNEMLHIFCCYWLHKLWFGSLLYNFFFVVIFSFVFNVDKARSRFVLPATLLLLSQSSSYHVAFPNLSDIWRHIKYFKVHSILYISWYNRINFKLL